MTLDQMLNQVRKAAEERALKSLMECISISAGTVVAHERGFLVNVNVDLDDVGGDSYNPEYHKFNLQGEPLDDKADIGEELEHHED